MSKLHDQLIVIDGLNVSNFSRPVFEAMRRGGLTAANCTCFDLEKLQRLDTITSCSGRHGSTSIRGPPPPRSIPPRTSTAPGQGRRGKGICLGWQNTSGIEDDLRHPGAVQGVGRRDHATDLQHAELVGAGVTSPTTRASDFGRDVVGRNEPSEDPLRSLPRRAETSGRASSLGPARLVLALLPAA